MPKLEPQQLRRTFAPTVMDCETTEDVEPTGTIVGQERAVKALEFGLGITSDGFNTYVAGPPGIGKMTAVHTYLERVARDRQAPPDWCYVHNFDEPYQPRTVRLPAGLGRRFRHDMEALVEHVRRELPKAFESDEYISKRDEIVDALNSEREAIMTTLNEQVAKAGFALKPTPVGLVMLPLKDGKPLTEEEFAALPQDDQDNFAKERDKLQAVVKESLKRSHKLERTLYEKMHTLDRGVLDYLVDSVIEELAERYAAAPAVGEYLEAVRRDMVANISTFKKDGRGADGDGPRTLADLKPGADTPFRKYEVNVLVDHTDTAGAPVVVELNPSYNNIFGRVEREPEYGALRTDFTLIRGGSMHRANGGYLVLQVEDLLRNYGSWDALKRALRSRRIDIEELAERLGLMSTKGLQPEPVPLDIKVILVGRPHIYHLLYQLDEDFAGLFKVKADFDTQMEVNDANVESFVRFVCTLCCKEELLHLERSAVARLLESAARMADDKDKLSTEFGAIADLVREASYWARKEGATVVAAAHVDRARDEKVYRSALLSEHIQRLMAEGTLLIDTDGERVGALNGLSVLSLGDYHFGRPSRITATVAPGRKGVVDIEREVELGGPIHSKGVLILGGFLTNRFGSTQPLSVEARLVFEQSYSGVDGDSASCAELYALLSALSDVPLRQGIAVTGSLNQRGDVQAIGGVNEKIEGYFEVCRQRGFAGTPGVMIPASNVRHLMLREDVVEAVTAGKFQIWSAADVDEGVEILTGIPAGRADADGSFPAGSVNARVVTRLAALSEAMRKATAPTAEAPAPPATGAPS